MPKAEKGTPKDIAKRIKSKGLQKLKFYCQMCEKQCRDANGFKCHLTSESHLRQMKIFSENANHIMDNYSREFEQMYLSTLKQRHTTKRVNANNVYQEVIADKQHIHMNSTKWATLSDFVMYLGKSGKCVVDETERGWYVQYIENDASIIARKEAQEKRAEAERQAEIQQAQRMKQQRIEAAKALDRVGGAVHLEATKLQRNNNISGAKVSVALKTNPGGSSSAGDDTNKKKKKKIKNKDALGFFGDDNDDDNDDDDDEKQQQKQQAASSKLSSTLPPLNAAQSSASNKRTVAGSGKESSKRQKISEQKQQQEHEEHKRKHKNENNDSSDNKTSKNSVKNISDTDKKNDNDKKSSSQRDDNDDSNDGNADGDMWLKRDIIVRIITKKLANGKYFRRKAIVDRVIKDHQCIAAEVEVMPTEEEEDDRQGDNGGGDVLRLDQNDLETVIPKKEGKKVRILRGKYRGEKAKIISLDKKKYRATLKLSSSSGTDGGKILEKVNFDDFSQLA